MEHFSATFEIFGVWLCSDFFTLDRFSKKFSISSARCFMLHSSSTYETSMVFSYIFFVCVQSLMKWVFLLVLQSRVGPVEWLKPYTDETIIELGQKGVKSLLAVPIRYMYLHSTLWWSMIWYNRNCHRQRNLMLWFWK